MPAGRPTKYKKEYCKQANRLTKLGATDQELADFFEVNVDSIKEWKKQHPEFSAALKVGKSGADSKVAHRLYQRAIGYSHEDVDIRVIEGKIVQTKLIKHYPPDPVAAIFWLKNRRPDKWRDRQDLSVEGDLKINLTRTIVK